MNDQLIQQVEELGLSNKEARVYVANLMLGPAGVQQIADASGIKRVTTYVILESLISLGLVSQTVKAKKTHFNAEAPENLRRLLEKKEQSLKDQQDQLNELLPQLSNLATITKDAPSVKFYDGAEGIRTITKLFLAELQKDRDVTYGITNRDDVDTFFPEIAKHGGNPERTKLGVKSRIIYTRAGGPIDGMNDSELNRESRFVPADKLGIRGDVSVIGDKVIILSLTGNKPTGVVIESKDHAQTMLTLFELAWNQLA